MSSRHIALPQLADSEDWYNAALARRRNPGDPVIRVCMHLDRTVFTAVGRQGLTTQCDYCDRSVYDPGYGPQPDLMPIQYVDQGET